MKKIILIALIAFSTSINAVEFKGKDTATMSNQERQDFVMQLSFPELVSLVKSLQITPADCNVYLWLGIQERLRDFTVPGLEGKELEDAKMIIKKRGSSALACRKKFGYKDIL